jgi:hypothetical protein
MTKDEALNLIQRLEDAAIASYEFINGINRRGKMESRTRTEVKAARAILKHLTEEEITDREIEDFIG